MKLFPNVIYRRVSGLNATFYRNTCYINSRRAPVLDDWSWRIPGTRLKALAVFDDNPIARK